MASQGDQMGRKNGNDSPFGELARGRRAVLPYWEWIAILLSLTALATCAIVFANTGNPAMLVIALVAGYLAYGLTR